MPRSGDSRFTAIDVADTRKHAPKSRSWRKPLVCCVALASRLVTELCLLLVVAAASGVYFAHVVSRTVTMEPHGACCPPATDTSALSLVLWWWRDGLLGCCLSHGPTGALDIPTNGRLSVSTTPFRSANVVVVAAHSGVSSE